MKKDINEAETDKRLSDLLKKELPAVRRDDWFHNKVMNRLPPRKRPARAIETVALVLLFVGLGVGVAFQSHHILNAQILYVKDFLMMGLFVLSFLFVSLWILVPYLKN